MSKTENNQVKPQMKSSTKHLPCCFCGDPVDNNADELCYECQQMQTED